MSARVLRWVAILIALATVTVTAACQRPLQPAQEVAELRVLGIRLDPPDARPGDEVTATALIVDEAGNDWTASWYACPVPISAADYFSATFDPAGSFCDDYDETYGDLVGSGDTATFTVPEGFLDDAAQLLEDEGFEDVDGSLDQLMAFIGWHMRLNLVVERVDGSDDIRAFKRVVVSGLGGQNTNPDPPAVHIRRDDNPGAANPVDVKADPPSDGSCVVDISPETTFVQDVKYILAPVNVPEVYEEYVQIDFLGETSVIEEEVWYSWFSTHRAFNQHVTKAGSPDNRFEVGNPKAGDPVEDEDGNQYLPLWVVVRDGRGGTAWCSQNIPFVPATE